MMGKEEKKLVPGEMSVGEQRNSGVSKCVWAAPQDLREGEACRTPDDRARGLEGGLHPAVWAGCCVHASGHTRSHGALQLRAGPLAGRYRQVKSCTVMPGCFLGPAVGVAGDTLSRLGCGLRFCRQTACRMSLWSWPPFASPAGGVEPLPMFVGGVFPPL